MCGMLVIFYYYGFFIATGWVFKKFALQNRNNISFARKIVMVYSLIFGTKIYHEVLANYE